MSGEIKIKERVSEYRCYVLDDFTDAGIQALVKWVETEIQQWCKILVEKRIMYLGDTGRSETLLTLEMGTNGDSSYKSKIEYTGAPIYAVAGRDWVDLKTKEEFDEDFGIVDG